MPHPDIPTDMDQIEAQIARDRSALADTLAHLQGRLSPDTLIDSARVMLRDNAGACTRAIDRTVRANPAALAVTAAGLAWLLLGRRRAAAPEPVPVLAGTRFEAMSRWEDEGGPPPPEREAEPRDDWMAEAEALRDRANQTLRLLDGSVRDRAAGGDVMARDRAAILSRLTDDVRDVMHRGLSQLSSEAQARIVAAREAAYAAHLDLRGKVGRTIEDHPLATGAVAAVIGAAVAAVLPQTQTEHRVFGSSRDRLLDDAQRALEDERVRAGLVASALATVQGGQSDHAARNIMAGMTARH